MTLLLLLLVPLVIALYVLIHSINQGTHYAPQAYYRKKRRGASLVYGFTSLIPRRRRPPEETAHEK